MTDLFSTAAQLIRRNQHRFVWQKYCGYLDLSIKEFMEIQSRLLLEQIERLRGCELGRRFLRGANPTTVSEFTSKVPLTVYEEYREFLDKDKENGLPSRPAVWTRSSGRSNEKKFKWVPYSDEMLLKVGEFAVASFILASCIDKGDVRLANGNTCLYTLAPAPYFTGAVVAGGLMRHLDVRFLPPFEESSHLDFKERVKAGFKDAFVEGIDFFYGLSSVLVTVGKQLGDGGGSFAFSPKMLRPSCLARIVKALFIKYILKRPLLPRDLWQVKGIIAGGMDTSFYKEKIENLWGAKPLEGYGGTEMGGVAIQAWNRKGMTFLPDSNFLEFIREDDFYKMQDNPLFIPRVYRLDEVEEGVYELVVSNFNGGIFVRYRTGDLIRIVGKEDPELGIKIPQMTFHARADGVIDLNGITRFTEKQIWYIIETLKVPYTDWCIRKEFSGTRSVLHLYLEPKGTTQLDGIKELMNERLRKEDSGYDWMIQMLGMDPLEVTILNEGTFAAYMELRQQEGADMAHIKPPHFNAKDSVIERLLRLSNAEDISAAKVLVKPD